MTRKPTAIPGGGTGKSSAYLLRTKDGYRAAGDLMAKKPAARTGERRALGTAGLAYNINSWVADKQNAGEIGTGLFGDASGTSIFDPVLAELCYRWFCPPAGTILDPFAGGSVRGIVASVLGRSYVGIELSARQIEANRGQAERICREPKPRWIEGDSRHIRALATGIAADFIFSCPPYADLERYSDDPADLSTLPYAEFRAAYRAIIGETCAMLRDDRFACFVVGDVRDPKGLYYGFPWHTIEAFEDAGLRLYNEAIQVTAAGSLALRAGKQFEATRKLGKSHQQCLVFIKGDPKRATEAVGKVEFGSVDAEETPPEPGDAKYGERL